MKKARRNRKIRTRVNQSEVAGLPIGEFIPVEGIEITPQGELLVCMKDTDLRETVEVMTLEQAESKENPRRAKKNRKRTGR